MDMIVRGYLDRGVHISILCTRYALFGPLKVSSLTKLGLTSTFFILIKMFKSHFKYWNDHFLPGSIAMNTARYTTVAISSPYEKLSRRFSVYYPSVYSS